MISLWNLYLLGPLLVCYSKSLVVDVRIYISTNPLNWWHYFLSRRWYLAWCAKINHLVLTLSRRLLHMLRWWSRIICLAPLLVEEGLDPLRWSHFARVFPKGWRWHREATDLRRAHVAGQGRPGVARRILDSPTAAHSPTSLLDLKPFAMLAQEPGLAPPQPRCSPRWHPCWTRCWCQEQQARSPDATAHSSYHNTSRSIWIQEEEGEEVRKISLLFWFVWLGLWIPPDLFSNWFGF